MYDTGGSPNYGGTGVMEEYSEAGEAESPGALPAFSRFAPAFAAVTSRPSIVYGANTLASNAYGQSVRTVHIHPCARYNKVCNIEPRLNERDPKVDFGEIILEIIKNEFV